MINSRRDSAALTRSPGVAIIIRERCKTVLPRQLRDERSHGIRVRVIVAMIREEYWVKTVHRTGRAHILPARCCWRRAIVERYTQCLQASFIHRRPAVAVSLRLPVHSD